MNDSASPKAEVAVLLNPAAGGGRSGRERDRLTALFRERNIPHRLYVTESEAHLRELARRTSREFGTIAAAGGDSTFQIVAEEIVKSGAGARLALFGLGSSNDITREFGLETPEQSAAALAQGRSRRIDLGRIDSGGASLRYFIGQATIGLGVFVNRFAARTASRAPALARFQTAVGAWAVARAFRKSLVPLALTVAAGGRTISGRFDVAHFANIRYWATGRMLVPQARPDDGALDACLISGGSFLRLAHLARAAGKGRDIRSEGVTYLRSPTFDIASKDPFGVQADGEVIGDGASPTLFEEIRVRVLPGALVLVA
jgi:diacylglycerol kinase (ATP)